MVEPPTSWRVAIVDHQRFTELAGHVLDVTWRMPTDLMRSGSPSAVRWFARIWILPRTLPPRQSIGMRAHSFKPTIGRRPILDAGHVVLVAAASTPPGPFDMPRIERNHLLRNVFQPRREAVAPRRVHAVDCAQQFWIRAGGALSGVGNEQVEVRAGLAAVRIDPEMGSKWGFELGEE